MTSYQKLTSRLAIISKQISKKEEALVGYVVVEEDCGQELDDPFEFEENAVEYMWASCSCSWRGSGMFYKGDAYDLLKCWYRVLQDHSDKAPDCDLEPRVY